MEFQFVDLWEVGLEDWGDLEASIMLSKTSPGVREAARAFVSLSSLDEDELQRLGHRMASLCLET
jgi:hypothetical protein